MSKGLIVDLSGDKPRLGKRGPKGWNKHTPEGAEDGAPNEVTSPTGRTNVEGPEQQTLHGHSDLGKALRKQMEEDPDIVTYAKSLTLVEMGGFLTKNGIDANLVKNAPNGGVAKMRAMNAIRSAVKGGRTLVK